MNDPRLLSVNNFHYRRAGSDAAFLDHDRLFRERGWQTAVFSMRHRENLPSPWEPFFVDEIELERQYSLGTKIGIAAKILYSREARAKLEQLLAVFQPDVVHLHSVYHHISPSILPLLHGLGVPVVMTAHDYKLACPAYKMFDGEGVCEDCRGGSLMPLVRKRCIHGSTALSAFVAFETALHRWLGFYERYIDRIVCPSRFQLEKLASWGWPRERLVHVQNFVDADAWPPRFAPGDHVLYFGRLAPEKGLHTLLRACALADCAVKLIGWGTERDALEQQARTLGARVQIIERLPAEQLSDHIRAARCVVVPSEWYENASLAVLEAFACGKPVIASRIGGTPELVRHGSNGWLFEPGDVPGLAECLRAVMHMPDEAVEVMGRRAHTAVREQFSAGRYYDGMTQLYADLGAKVPDLQTPASLLPQLEKPCESVA